MASTVRLVAAMVVALAVAGFGVAALAGEGTVKAMAPWRGQGYAFPVGEDQVYMVAVYSGVMFVDDGKGPLHEASIVCPGTVNGNMKTMTKTGEGRCIITDGDGDRVYASFTCKGDPEGCRGPFKLVSGTGKFAGITGEGEMISRIQGRQVMVVAGYEGAQQLGEGVAVWPKLTYKIPSSK